MSTAIKGLDAYDVVCQEMGRVSLYDAMYIAWEFTGYPHWWNIPADGATPQECFRKQVREFRDATRGGAA